MEVAEVLWAVAEVDEVDWAERISAEVVMAFSEVAEVTDEESSVAEDEVVDATTGVSLLEVPGVIANPAEMQADRKST